MSAQALQGKHIVVGVCGGIAAYKTATLVRLLIKAGAEVQVIMTPSAREFITPLTLSTLSGNPVITEFFTANTGEWHSHVQLGLWADAMVIAPATASTIAKMATGVADNMLVTSYLSCRAQVFVAPAMDLDMMAHPTTTRNLDTLRSDGCIVIEPAAGELASHLVGRGRMEEPERIFERLAEYFSKGKTLTGKHLLITAGPTYERIDPVRFIGNFSTGKMGYAIANEAARRGARVTLVSGPVGEIPTVEGVTVVRVESAQQMLTAAQQAFASADVAVLAAAVADYRPAQQFDRKIKREHDGIEQIQLVKNPDIAATLGAQKADNQRLVGFALETDRPMEHAAEKLARKHLDMIVVNSLSDPGAGFGFDTNKVTLIFADGRCPASFPLKTKAEVAADILNNIESLIE